MYALYHSYGFTKGQIGQLFIVGFGSSMVFGTVVGGLADKYGRKANCLIFCVLYGLSCVTKHYNDFFILLVGRLLGGVATSILTSAFETWMIAEHRSNGWPEDWMKPTFTSMSFGSGLVAIVAGLFASWLASSFGYVAPFDASLLLLIGGGIVIATSWRENYGGASGAPPTTATTASVASRFDNFTKTWRLLLSDERVLLLGVIQSCFESAMYIFVFMWTPALEAAAKASLSYVTATSLDIPHGLIFAIFMVAIMLGSKAFELLVGSGAGQYSVENLARWVFVAASLALAVPILTTSHTAVLLAFVVFELCCGLYFPSAGVMRSKYLPEEIRSTTMNVYRIGLNVLVCVTLVNIEAVSQDVVFFFTVLLLVAALLAQHRLFGNAEGRAHHRVPVSEEAAADAAPEAGALAGH